jgi:hypothetical protein
MPESLLFLSSVHSVILLSWTSWVLGGSWTSVGAGMDVCTTSTWYTTVVFRIQLLQQLLIDQMKITFVLCTTPRLAFL